MSLQLYPLLLKILKKIYSLVSGNNFELRNWKMFSNKAYANNLIYQQLISEDPCMIARFGSTELSAVINFIGIHNKSKYKNSRSFITQNTPSWWWDKSIVKQLHLNSGFYPSNINKIENFCTLMLTDTHEIDVLGSWLSDEKYINSYLNNCKKVVLEDLEPFFTDNPWTRALEGKRVLVIHPFTKTIQKQYKKRELIFEKNFLPEFQLETIQAVQSIAGNETDFEDWFAALEFMKDKIDKANYDICIIGCGAYGFPLAAHVKRSGKKAIHLGGATQLLFGIKGARWENYVVWPYQNLFNEHWVRPSDDERPKNAELIEGACYW